MSTDKTHEIINLSVIEPWEQIGRSLTEQRAIEESHSEEAQECGRLASAIIRLASEFGLDGRDLNRRSAEWALVASAAEASRGRLLSTAARRTKLTAAACFEADGEGNYRFINNRVSIVHPTAGKVDFLVASAGAIKFLLAELGLENNWMAEIPEGPPVFSPSVVLGAGPDKDRVFQGLQIQFYKRDASGSLGKYQPKEWQLELKTTA